MVEEAQFSAGAPAPAPLGYFFPRWAKQLASPRKWSVSQSTPSWRRSIMRRNSRSSKRQARASKRPPRSYHPMLELLEERWLPASSLTLGLLNDTGGGTGWTHDARLVGQFSDPGHDVGNHLIDFDCHWSGVDNDSGDDYSDVRTDDSGSFAVELGAT